MMYRKKPAVIEAYQLPDARDESTTEIPYWLMQAVLSGSVKMDADSNTATITTLEGTMTANVGDWIIQGVKDEIYPCKPDIFEATYEPVQ